MAFVAEGFTKRYCDTARTELRSLNPDVFDLADKCGAHAATITAILEKPKNRRQLILSLFFCRCMSHFQAACMLAECGMSSTAFETLWQMYTEIYAVHHPW
jgi:ABC-type sulfate transport system permease component